jgi:hypothetical protein
MWTLSAIRFPTISKSKLVEIRSAPDPARSLISFVFHLHLAGKITQEKLANYANSALVQQATMQDISCTETNFLNFKVTGNSLYE